MAGREIKARIETLTIDNATAHDSAEAHEVIVESDWGDFSWGIWVDVDVAGHEAAVLNEMFDIVSAPEDREELLKTRVRKETIQAVIELLVKSDDDPEVPPGDYMKIAQFIDGEMPR